MTDNPIKLDEEKLEYLGDLVTGIAENSTVGGGWNEIVKFVQDQMDASFLAGRGTMADELMKDGIVRRAFLEAQAKWLDAAGSAEGLAGKVIAELIANEMKLLADQYRTIRTDVIKDAPLPELHDGDKSRQD